MSLVILQPCSNKGSRKHYQDTIQKPVPIDQVAHLLSKEDARILKDIYPDGQLKVWGVVPGKEGSNNVTRWKRIQPGDVTLLAAQGRVFASAVATHKTHNGKLAEKLWGRNEDNQTWEYVYFVSEVRAQNILYKDLNKVIPYAENFVIQGFSVLNQEQSDNVINSFELASDTFYPEVDVDELCSELKNEESLDSTSQVTSRKEQAYLRKSLFKNHPFGKCCICGEEFPVTFLVAAHIKKRSSCTLDEKKDFGNIVAPMCKMGCDELYEKGYVGVQNGKVIVLKKFPSSIKLGKYLDGISQNSCSFWHKNTEKYFSWHVEKNKN